MPSIRARSRTRVPGRPHVPDAASINPLTVVAWPHAWWTSGPRMAALGLADAASVATLPDEIGNWDMTAAGAAQPTWQASDALFNGRPSILCDNTDDRLRYAAASLPQPYSMVAIFKYNTVDASSRLFGNCNINTAGGIGITATNKWVFSAVTNLVSTGDADTAAHLLRGYANTTSGALALDGTTLATGTTGATNLAAISAGVDAHTTPANWADGRFVFLGVYSGDVSTDLGWPQFKAWAKAFYGITTIV